jgi:hypothetical protein
MAIDRRTALFLAGLAIFPVPARAITLDFTGTGLASCAFTNESAGTLNQRADLMGWTTKDPATVTVTNSGPSTLSITGPTQWATAPAQTPSTDFTTTATVTGTNNLGTLTGSSLTSIALSLIGVNNVAVSLAASASTIYPAGSYKAQVTVTCAMP